MQPSCHTSPETCSEINNDLALALTLVYQPNNLGMTNLARESESREYCACTFMLNNLHITFRAAHSTTKKIGQFVTLWKRISTGPIQPYDLSDPIDLFVVSVRSGEHFGQFVFPKKVLCTRDIVAQEGKGGKRAIRVYPPWDKPESKQAAASQKWQLNYFLSIPHQAPVDVKQVKMLYSTT